MSEFESATELLERRNQLRELNWDKRQNRFTNEEVKTDIWIAYNKLLENWDFVMAKLYYNLLRKQVNETSKTMAINPISSSGTISILNSQITRSTTVDWKEEVSPYYESMSLDFAYLQIELLLPDELKENYVFSQTEQDQILRARRRLPRQTIIQDGFHPRRKRGLAIPLNRQAYNRQSKEFIERRLTNLLPDMSTTMKNNLNRALRKSIDEANSFGLTGKAYDDYVAKGISKSLGKKNLGRAMNIARTEGTAISNFGLQESAKQTGLQLEKEWITRRDGLVRDAHLSMDGIRVPENSEFSVYGYRMERPGDDSGGAPAGLVCNCRCSMIFHEIRI